MTYLSSHPGYRELELPSYEKGKLRLVEPKIEYAHIGLKWITDVEAVQYMGADFSEPSIEKELERMKKIIASVDEYNWAIELDGEIIGNVALNDITEKSTETGLKTGNFAILIGDKQHWGKGIGQSVTRAVLDWAFQQGGFEIIVARALEPNTGSIKTLTKLGFEKTGTEPYDGLVNGQRTNWVNFKISKPQKLP